MTSPTEHKPLPVPGYTPQTAANLALVARNKFHEERILRLIESYAASTVEGKKVFDARCLALARTHIEDAFMWLNRGIMQPRRVTLPEDETSPQAESVTPDVYTPPKS